MNNDRGPGRLRVVVADVDGLARQAVSAELRRAGIVVVAEAVRGPEAIDLTLHYRPDVLLMDVAIPQLGGIATTRRILEQDPEARVVLMAAALDDALSLSALRSGAVGVMAKDMPLEALPGTLRGVARGEAALSRELTWRLVEQYRLLSQRLGMMRPVRSVLTGREWEVLDLLASGAGTDAVAERLYLEPATVRSHLKNAMRKLEVTNRQDAIAIVQGMRVLEEGLDPVLDPAQDAAA